MKARVSLALAIAVTMLLCRSAAFAAQPPPLVAVPLAAVPPVIDGNLSGGEWEQAARVGAFVKAADGTLAARPCTALLTADDKALYVGFTVYFEGKPVLRGQERPRDGAVWEDDAVEVFLDPGQTKAHFFQFIINSKGSVYDAKDAKTDFNADLSVKTQVGEKSWTAEIAIPFASLGVPAPKAGEQWGATFCCDATDGKEASSWADTGNRFENPAQFGTLLFGGKAALQVGPVWQPGKGQWSVPVAVVSPDTVDAEITETISRGDTILKTLRAKGQALPGMPLPLGEVPPSFDIGGTYTIKIEATAGGSPLYAQTAAFGLRGQMRLFVSKAVLREGAFVVVEAGGAAKAGEPLEATLTLHDAQGQGVGKPRQVRLQGGLAKTGVFMPEAPGKYTLQAVLTSQGKELSRTEETIERLPKPEWLGSSAGESEKVQPPFTPLTVKGTRVSCWGRSYDFGQSAFPTGVSTKEQQILAGPVQFVGTVAGKTLQWKSDEHQLVGNGQVALGVAGQTAPGLDLNCYRQVDFDGCLTNDVVLQASPNQTIDRLALEIPLKPQFAKYIHSAAADWGQSYSSGITGPGWKWERSFVPYVWLGDESRGLAWFSESDEPFRLNDRSKTLQVIHEGNRVVLRINLIDHPVRLDDDLRWRFGLQATPVKEVPKRLPHLWHGAYFGMEKQVYSLAQTLTYPAKGNLDLAKGTLEQVFTVEFDPTEATKNKRNQTLFSAKMASGNTVVAFWDYEAQGVWFYVGVGANYPFTYPIHLASYHAGWKKGETHHFALTWGETTRMYLDGKLAIESKPYAGWLTDPLDNVDLMIGSIGTEQGEFAFQELRIADAPASAETIAAHAAQVLQLGSKCELPDEPGTLLLDHFRGLDEKGQPLPAAKMAEHGPKTDHATLKAPGERRDGGLFTGATGTPLTVLDYLKSKGVEVVVYHDTWTDQFGLPTTPFKDELHSLVKAVHDHGMRIIVYFGYGLAGTTPQMKDYHDLWTVWPLIPWSGGKPERTFDAGCNRSELPDFIADGMGKLAEEFDIDGVYLDGTTECFGCVNYNHGCGYLRDGQWVKTYPLWANRDFMRRIYTIFHERKPNALVDSHMSGNMIIPELSFCDSYWDGEQFEGYKHGDQTVDELMPLDKFRAEFMGKQWGLRAEFLNYEKRPFTMNESLAFVLLHDMYVRASGTGEHLDKVAAAWKAFDDFGTDKATWLPYWEQQAAVPGATGTYCSAYTRPGQGVLLVVSNLTGKPAEAVVKLDRAKLGLGAQAAATDAITGEKLLLTPQGLPLHLESMSYRLVRLK